METWAWLLAYVVGFGLLQLVLYQHFRRNDATVDAAGGANDGATSQHVDDVAGDAAGLHCQHCGARNDHSPAVRYCRRCVNPIR